MNEVSVLPLRRPAPRLSVYPSWARDPFLLALLALPLILLVIAPDWIYTAVGTMDPWIYLGFFRDFPRHQTELFPVTYYGSRLSWNIPGYLLYRCLPPLAANHVLHLAVYYTAVLSLYSLVSRLIGRRAAVLAAAMMGAYRYFLAAAGWDYVDGVGIAYYLLMLALLVRSLQRDRPAGWLSGAGAAAAAMIYANLFLVCFLPSLPLCYLLMKRHLANAPWHHRLVRHTLAVLLGAALVTVVLGAINRGVGGEFWFFIPSIRFSTSLVSAPNPWRLPWSEIWWRVHWLLLPALMLLGGLASVARQWMRPDGIPLRPRLFLATNLGLCTAAMLYMELKGSPVLQVWCYGSYLIAPAFLMMGGLLGDALPELSPARFAALLIGALAVWLAYLAPSARLSLAASERGQALGLIALGLAGIAAPFLWRRRLAGALLLLLALGLTHMGLRPAPSSGAWRGGRSRDNFLLVNRAIPTVQAITQSRVPHFWYAQDEPLSAEYTALSSTFLWGYNLINTTFPSLEKAIPLVPRMILVIPSQRLDTFEQARAAVAGKGLGLRLLQERQVREGAITYQLTFAEVLPPEPSNSADHGTADLFIRKP